MSHQTPESRSMNQESKRQFVLHDFMPFKVTVLSTKLSGIIARAYSERFGITIPEWRVLALLSQHKEISAQMVVEETPLDKVAVSRAVAGLVEKGHVSKSASQSDKRVALLGLTLSGRRIAEEIQSLALSYETEAMTVLNAAETAQFHELLDRLISQAEKMASA